MTADPVFVFDVAYSSHDLLRQGVTEAGWTRVAVAAANHVRAAEIACQMAARHGMPTACRAVTRPDP